MGNRIDQNFPNRCNRIGRDVFSPHTVSIFLAVLIWGIFLTHSHAGPLSSALNNLSAPDRAALAQASTDRNTGILVTDDQGQVLFSRNADTPKVPASILKILTSFAPISTPCTLPGMRQPMHL
jgi:hypothetical protein